MITNAARIPVGIIPPEIVKGIVNVEKGILEHYKNNGESIITIDGGIGLMQITNLQDYDEDNLQYSIEYSILKSQFKCFSITLVDQTYQK